jgi:protein-L-isoaspartate(D-aspartate) O-methyltransferase
LRFTAEVRSSAVIDAFVTVSREKFVGPGPWRIKSPMDLAEYWTTDDDDPRQVYHDVLIARDESRGINNGQPSLWAYLFDRLDLAPGEQVVHLGYGTGYYTAIIAELVGSAGRVTAVEIDPTLAQKAENRARRLAPGQTDPRRRSRHFVRAGRRNRGKCGRNPSAIFMARCA